MTSKTKPRDRMYRSERAIRNYALHLGLMVRRRDSVLALYERYEGQRAPGQKRKIGEYRTWAAVERAIVRYGREWLRDNELRRRKGAAARARAPIHARPGAAS